MGKTKFQKIWKTDLPWLAAVRDQPHHARCTMYSTTFDIKGGAGQFKGHEQTAKHCYVLKEMQSQ